MITFSKHFIISFLTARNLSKNKGLKKFFEIFYIRFIFAFDFIRNFFNNKKNNYKNINSSKYFEENILMNTLLIKHSYRNNVKRFLGVLSSCIYPDNIKNTCEQNGDIVDIVNTKIDVNFIKKNSYDFIITFGYSFISLFLHSHKYLSFFSELKYRFSRLIIFILFALIFRVVSIFLQ